MAFTRFETYLTRCFLAVALMVSFAANANASATLLFEDEAPLEFTLEAPFSSLFGPMLSTGEYVEATLTFAPGTAEEGAASIPVKIRPRGKTRRNKDICGFPPLTLNFKKKAVGETVFAGQNKLKLVTHCQDRRTSYQTYYRQEYYIYKTYNLVTDESFQVRAANITYIDTEGKRKPVTRFAFFLEDADALATRAGLIRLKVKKISSASFDLEKSSRFALFQYLIGNLDFATLGGPPGDNCCHNSKPYADADGKAISVPYDFDFSGVVNAKYASPPEGIELRNIRVRLYRGLCIHNGTLSGAVALFNDKREAINALYAGAAALDERAASKTVRYYDGFYKTVNDPKQFDRKIARKCRG